MSGATSYACSRGAHQQCRGNVGTGLDKVPCDCACKHPGYRPQPLSAWERDEVYRIQVELRAEKVCAGDQRLTPVVLFEGYGARVCEPCRRQMASDAARAGAQLRRERDMWPKRRTSAA